MIKVFIRKGVLTVCLNLLILFLGYFTLPYLSNEFIPSIEIPAVAVILPTPLIDQKRLVSEVIAPVEKQLRKDGGIKSIEVRLMDSKVVFVLFYSWELEPSTALRKARISLSKIKLPSEVLAPIFVLHRPSNSPVLRTVIYGENLSQVSQQGRAIKSKLERIAGVSEVRILGSAEKALSLQVDPVKLSQAKINTSDLLLHAKKYWNFSFFRNNKVNQPTSIQYNLKEDDLSLLPIKTPLGIKSLGQLANINEKKAVPKVTFNDGRPAVVLEVLKSPGADTVTIVDKALSDVKLFFSSTDSGKTKFKVVYNESEKIIESQNGLFQNFAIGVFLNSMILMIFLGSAVGVVVASIVFPTAILGTVFVMKMLGISINLFSLNGFSLAVGMITDASTVVLESIVRRVQKGENLFDASLKGAQDVGLGVVASTLTTAGVLLPIAMQKNLSAKLFSDLSLTVVSTQLVCLIAVFSLVPWLCSKMLSATEKRNPVLEKVYRGSNFLVEQLVNLSNFTIAKAGNFKSFRFGFPLLAMLFSLGAIIFVPDTEFLPQVSSRIYSINLPINESQREMKSAAVAKEFSTVLSAQEKIDWNLVQETSDGVEVLLGFKGAADKKDILSILAPSKLDVTKLNLVPIGPAPSGESMGFHGLYFLSGRLSQEERSQLRQKLCDLDEVDYCLGKEHKELKQLGLLPNQISTQRAGLTSIESTSQLLFPIYPVDLLSFTSFNLKNPLYLSMQDRTSLLDIPISVKGNWLISLGGLYNKSINLFDSIKIRLNGETFTPLFFRLKNGTLGKVDQIISSYIHNSKISLQSMLGRGELETMNETFSSMIMALLYSAIIVFSILWIQFKSFSQACVIMSTIPLTLGGAILGLIIMHESINASVMVGFILLVGIIVNNGIFITEATNANLANGMSAQEAVRLATAERTRPILMTSFSTIFGMLPVLIIGGEGSELYRGMAVVNVFGMLVGTLLSLLVTPILIQYLGIKNGALNE